MNLKTNLYNFQYKLRHQLIGKYYGFRQDSGPEIDPQNFAPKKVLFILAGLLGDSVMSISTIIEARKLWPNSHFTVLGKKHNRDLLSACPLIDTFYECGADPLSLRKSAQIKDLQKWLNAENFDAAIILLGDQFAHLLARAKIPVRVGVKGTPLESCLTHIYDIGSPRTWGVRERLDALRCLGYDVNDSLPQLWVETEAEKSAQRKLSALGLKDDEKYAVLHPFGSTLRQWWGIENIALLANQLREKHNFKTVLVGGKETVPYIEKAVNTQVIDTIGELTLPELLAVIDGSSFVITTDSGPFHIAGALQKPIIGLFRARRPEHAEQYPTARVLLGRAENCQKMCKWDYCVENPCRQLSDISIKDILKVLNQQLYSLTVR